MTEASRSPQEQADYTNRHIDRTADLIHRRTVKAMDEGGELTRRRGGGDFFGPIVRHADMPLPDKLRRLEVAADDEKDKNHTVYRQRNSRGELTDHDGVRKDPETGKFEVSRKREGKEVTLMPDSTEVRIIDEAAGNRPTFETIPDTVRRELAAKALLETRKGRNEAIDILEQRRIAEEARVAQQAQEAERLAAAEVQQAAESESTAREHLSGLL